MKKKITFLILGTILLAVFGIVSLFFRPSARGDFNGHIAVSTSKGNICFLPITFLSDDCLPNNIFGKEISLSSDGKFVAISEVTPSPVQIFSFETKEEIELTTTENQPLVGTSPSWSADNTHIAIDGLTDIYVFNLANSSLTNLTNGQFYLAKEPAWSPDSTQIVFIARDDEDDQWWDLYTISVDGTETSRLTDNSSNASYPAWSPNASQIAFASDQDGDKEIIVLDLDTMEQFQLTDNTFTDDKPIWSPDGEQILYLSNPNNEYIWVSDARFEKMNVFLASNSGEDITSLTNFNRASVFSVSWSK